MTKVHLTAAERVTYQMISDAAEAGQPCPLNLDIEMELGFNSGSMGPKMVQRLERKGLIIVRRRQKYREVKIVETGKWTKKPAHMRTDNAHVPRGARRVGDTGLVADGAAYTFGKKVD